MDRRHLLTGVIIAGIVVIAGAWWFMGHTGFQPTVRHEVRIAGETYEVARWVGVAAPGEPEKTRACFRIDREIDAPPELVPRPGPAPEWLTCYDARFILRALASGEATAYVAQENDPPGWNRVIAVLPGRRAFMWHQPRGR